MRLAATFGSAPRRARAASLASRCCHTTNWPTIRRTPTIQTPALCATRTAGLKTTHCTGGNMDAQAQTIPSPKPTGKKVLCIEDEHFISELYVRALTRAGYEVTVEVDGQRGLELAKTDQFDIILLDLMIPTMTGTEVLRHLRNPAETPKLHAKIIITT